MTLSQRRCPCPVTFEGDTAGQPPIETSFSGQIDNTFHLNSFETLSAEEQPTREQKNATSILRPSRSAKLGLQSSHNHQPQALAQGTQPRHQAYVTRSVARRMETEKRQAEIERMAAERLKWDEYDGAKDEVVYWKGGIQNAHVKWGQEEGLQEFQNRMISLTQNVWEWLKET